MKKYLFIIAFAVGILFFLMKNNPFYYIGIYKNYANKKEERLSDFKLSLPEYCYLDEIISSRYNFNCVEKSGSSYVVSIIDNNLKNYDGDINLGFNQYKYKDFNHNKINYKYICNEYYCIFIKNNDLSMFEAGLSQ